nr:exopolyphosphatase PRUNE1-like isoform X3 [Coffea arabica]
MRSSSASMAANRQQETYIRARDNPFFDGMRRGEAEIMDKGSNFNLNEKIAGESIMRTASDVSSRRSRKITKHQSALKFGVEDVNESQKEHPPKSSQANEVTQTLALTKPMIEQSYSVNKDRTNLSKVPLPPSAALFYNGYSPQMEVVESCQSIYKLNMYLRARKDDVNAGVPGRFLHAVIGPDICDVGSVASTIMYAFYLNESLQNKLFCTVPIINMTRADMESRAELKWLLDACHVDQSSLVFLDEIDLSYYDLFGSLKLVLLNCNKLPARQEALKEALVEIFSCSKHDDGYSWVKNATFGEEASCSTLIAEKFLLTTPEILAGQRFSRLLLAGILMDTGNLRSPLSTSKDNYMATLLINGAGRYGCNGLYQILRYKMYDVPELSIGEILQKDIKKWTKIGKLISGNSRLTVLNIGMSSIGISIAQLLSLDSTSNLEISHFQRLEKLSLLLIVSGYHDAEKNFKREILVSAESVELLKNLIQFMKSSAPDLPLKILHHPDLREEMKAFEVDRVTSRKTIERLLEEYIEVSN